MSTSKYRKEILTHIRHYCREGAKLRLLHLAFGERLAELHDTVQARVALHRRIQAAAEQGKVALVSSGRDCDGSCWTNSVRLVDASAPIVVINQIESTLYDYTEGPSSITVMRPSEAAQLRTTHRDLALEAFENGHPGHLQYGSV